MIKRRKTKRQKTKRRKKKTSNAKTSNGQNVEGTKRRKHKTSKEENRKKTRITRKNHYLLKKKKEFTMCQTSFRAYLIDHNVKKDIWTTIPTRSWKILEMSFQNSVSCDVFEFDVLSCEILSLNHSRYIQKEF